MKRARWIAGVVAGGWMILGSLAHSLLGWPAIGRQFADTNVPRDLVRGLRIGWQFGGIAMLAFGIVVLALFTAREKSPIAPLVAQVIAVAYVIFGAWAFVLGDFNPVFVAAFIAPGLLLGIAARGLRV